MQEGILSLMQMPRTVAAIEIFKETKLPYIVLLQIQLQEVFLLHLQC